MPKLADTLVEGTLGQWLKQVGDSVARGEPLASIETDKVSTELTAPAAGTLLEQLVAEGQTVPIETPIARIGSGGGGTAVADASPAESPPASSAVAAPGASPPRSPAVTSLTAASASPPKATPVAARMLADHGLSADQVPTRSHRVTRDDVLAYVQNRQTRSLTPLTPVAIAEHMVTPLTPMRRAIAEHMTRSRQSIPHGQTVVAADLTELVAWRDARKASFLEAEGAPLTFTVLFVFALARQLTPPADIGVAVALEAGLIVPVVRRADSLSLGDTARRVQELAKRARARQLGLEETQAATMTLTNVGSFGNLTAAPIIPLGQLGILGPGLVERRLRPAPDGGVRPGWQCLLSLVYDRRRLDDFAADRFVNGVASRLRKLPPLPLGEFYPARHAGEG